MSIDIDCSFPGGNILVEKIDGDDVYLRQDLRDTTKWWFYWCFRIKGAAGRSIRFHFTDRNPIGENGPAKSRDLVDWSWVGTDTVEVSERPGKDGFGVRFTYAFAEDEDELHFCFSFRYVGDDLHRFLEPYSSNPGLRQEVLCKSNGGRNVEKLLLGHRHEDVEHRILLTARNHCCEMIASYAMEGAIREVLEGESSGYFLKHTEIMIIPFADKDGVEQGDQGKLRAPRDHNRDYDERSIYAETKALKKVAPTWGKGKLHVTFDLHCPWIRGKYNSDIYAVGCREQDIWARITDFCRILERVSTPAAPYQEKNNLPFGTAWNTGVSSSEGLSCAGWGRTLPDIDFGASFEIPYARFSDVDVTKEGAREFGENLMKALKVYLTRKTLSAGEREGMA
jgi:hypothetical protein